MIRSVLSACCWLTVFASTVSVEATVLAASGGGGKASETHRVLHVKGWTLHVNKSLYQNDPEGTARALELLEVQLDRVVKSVPPAALKQLRAVTIWINPPYEGSRGKAEYHPDAGWLRENGRDPAMTQAIELTNVSILPFENRRMPYFVLHELAHAWHHQVLGFDHPEVRAAYRRARDSGGYDEVKRFNGKTTIVDKAYAMTNHKEYFAETTEAFFGKNDFYPFNRAELKAHDPHMHDLLARLWSAAAAEDWIVESAEDWQHARAESNNLSFANGLARPTKDRAHFKSVIKSFDRQRRAKSITFRQSPAWDNWTPVPNVGPKATTNAPVFLPVADGDYWYFAAKRGAGRGYHAWHSTDMTSWTHHGRITRSHWVTTAEYADGKIYIYYDEPNDEDPHLVIAEDIKAGQFRDVGEVFADPSHGSDAGVIRIADGTFHLFYEDWTPINARKHSWDSPLAGHADSPDGINGFEPHEYPAPIDERTEPAGKFGTYIHGTTRKPYRYEVHEGPQDAYGDYTLIQVGDRFYLFCDYDPHDEPMRIGYWTNDSLATRFKWGGEIGSGFHPDPTIGFAEGRFYLIVQRAKQDYVSPGPWVDSVEARVGVDRDGDGSIDRWTDWRPVSERYARKPGFARIVETTPASFDLSSLPAGRGFQFEFKTDDATENKSRPIMDRVTISFQ